MLLFSGAPLRRGLWLGLAWLVAGGCMSLGGVAAAVAFAPPPSAIGVCQDPVCDRDDDHDLIPNVIEERITGSPTAATGREDANGDGLADWLSIAATGKATGIRPGADADRDGVPDWVELIMTGGKSRTSALGSTDSDRTYPPDFASIIVCGTPTCATGSEDFDGDGVADVKALIACTQGAAGAGGSGDSGGWLPWTGSEMPWTLVTLALAAVLCGVVLVWHRDRMRRVSGLLGGGL